MKQGQVKAVVTVEDDGEAERAEAGEHSAPVRQKRSEESLYGAQCDVRGTKLVAFQPACL